MGREDVQNTIDTVYFQKQVKQDQHKDKNQNIIQSLNKTDTSYNPDSLNYINKNFKNVILEDMSNEKVIIHR